MNKNSRVFLFVSVCVLVLLVLQSLNITDDTQDAVIDDKSNDRSINPKSAGYWELTAVVLIDDSATGVDAKNWTWAVAQVWCSGVGNSTHPFLIENVSISVASASSGLLITNSNSTTYFKLSNITITNTVGDGLELNSVSNGTVISSKFSNNGDTGISMINANSTSITLTTCLNNTVDGIYVVNSSLNTFIVDCINNTQYGLILASSMNNTIKSGEFIGNEEVGLAIIEIAGHNNSTDNEIYGNTFENNTINGVDNCTIANQWDNGVNLGNDWDDYDGEDVDDDLIGDTPYDISGSAEAQDNYPYCSDGDTPDSPASKDTDRDLWEAVNPTTIAIFVGIFFGIICAILVISKFLLADRR